jgi:ribose 5-phosphate isomerase A
LSALKSGGGVHTSEKVLAAMTDEFILVGDAAKRVERFFHPVRSVVRRSENKDGAVINDRLLGIPGILEHSLFYNLAHRAIVAGPDGVKQYSRSGML